MTTRGDAPRRLSTSDEGFAAYMPVVVSLDGADQRDVVAYDCDAGTITRVARTPSGWLKIDPASGDVIEETVHGQVTARLG